MVLNENKMQQKKILVVTLTKVGRAVNRSGADISPSPKQDEQEEEEGEELEVVVRSMHGF